MMKLNTLTSIALAAIAVGCFAPQVRAQAAPENVSDAITRALFERSGDIYQNSGIGRQATLLFGLSYPDLEYVADAQSVENIYREGLRVQASKDGGAVRTRDLPNPFSSSIGNSTP